MTSVEQGIPDPHAYLERGISQPRFQAFLACAGNQPVLARKLYVWNRDLSVAILADVAVLEVALRNAMHDAATAAWGAHWYADRAVLLDDRSGGQVSSAWNYLHASIKQRPHDADVPGRVVAQCMFGFWTNLLDAGGYLGKQPRRVAADYDDLWNQAFKNAFPGGRSEAKRQRDARIAALPPSPRHEAQVIRLRQEVAFTRTWVHGICKTINELRNRVAHHEPLIHGFPLNGQQHRLTTQDGHDLMRALTRMIDRDLATWLDTNTTVPQLLQNRPC